MPIQAFWLLYMQWTALHEGRRCRLARTRKDRQDANLRSLEVVKKDDGTFDLFFNQVLARSAIPEKWLNEELCAGYGFCGEEYLSILRDVAQHGSATIVF